MNVYMWEVVLSNLDAVQAMQTSRVCKAAHCAALHLAKHVRPKKTKPDAFTVSSTNWTHLNKVYDAGVREFIFFAYKIPVGLWFFRALQLVCSLPIRGIVINVWRQSYRMQSNTMHDRQVLDILHAGEYKTTVERLFVDVCGNEPFLLRVDNSQRLAQIRVIGDFIQVEVPKCLEKLTLSMNISRAMASSLTRLVYLDIYVDADMLSNVMSLPMLRRARLVVRGDLTTGPVVLPPAMTDLSMSSVARFSTKIYGPVLRVLELNLSFADVAIRCDNVMESITIGGYMCLGRSVHIDFGNLVVQQLSVHCQDTPFLINVKPNRLYVDSTIGVGDMSFNHAFELEEGCVVDLVATSTGAYLFGTPLRPGLAWHLIGVSKWMSETTTRFQIVKNRQIGRCA